MIDYVFGALMIFLIAGAVFVLAMSRMMMRVATHGMPAIAALTRNHLQKFFQLSADGGIAILTVNGSRDILHLKQEIEANDYTVIFLRASLWASEEEYALRLLRTFGRDQLKKRSDKERIVLKFSYVVDLFVFMLAYEAFLRQAGKRPEVSFPSFKDKAVVRQIVFEDDLAAEESMLAANSAAAQG